MACPAPPFTIIQSPFHLYKAVPFNVPAQQIELRTPCSTNHPGRDYTFNGANFGTSVRAIESGIVEYAITSANTGNSSCICVQGDISCLQRECNPTAVGILSDGIITEYVHVEPSVTRGQVIKAGDIIGQLALRGTFVVLPGGNPLPHVHINRKRTWTGPVCQQEFICDWGIDGIDNRNPQNPPPTCSNGWSLNNNGEWMFCQNGVPQRGWFPGAGGNSFFTDSNGVWAGFIRTPSGNIQYRPRQFRNLPASDPNVNTVVRGDWVCSLDQWWFFDNNGNMVSNTTVGRNQNGQWVPGLPGRQIASDGHCTDCAPSPCSPQT